MLLSEIDYGSFLVYSPRGSGPEAQRSRSIGRAIKNDAQIGSEAMSSFVARRLREEIVGTELNGFFDRRPVLVPVPRSSLLRPGALWPAMNLARALVDCGFGFKVEPALERVVGVRKSATGSPAERPRAQHHYETTTAHALLIPPAEVVLVDDIITRGATLVGVANRLREAFPRANIRAFAVMRTMSDSDDFPSVIQPVVGRITIRNAETYREP